MMQILNIGKTIIVVVCCNDLADQYDRLARDRDYLYRKMYYDTYRRGGVGAYNYGYFDELYNTDPR